MVIERKIDSFLGKLDLGIEFFNEAGKLLVEMLDEDPQAFERIEKHAGVQWLTSDVLATFEQIGRGKLAVEALFLPQHVVNRIVALSVEAQTAIARNPVPVFSGTRYGVHKTDCKPASRLSRRDAALAIGPNGLRPVEEQVAIEAEQKEGKMIGKFTVFVVAGSPMIRRSATSAPATKLFVGKDGKAEIEIIEKA